MKLGLKITKQLILVLGLIVIIAVSGGYYYYTTYVVPPKFITFATWGGDWTNAFNSTIKAYEAKYGVEVKIYTQASSGDTRGKIRAEKNQPSIDIWFGGQDSCRIVAEEGLAVDLTGKVPNLAQVHSTYYPGELPEVVPFLVNAHGWYYREDLIPSNLVFNGSFTWFWDPAFEGKLAVPTPAWSSFTEQLSIVAGDRHDYVKGQELVKSLVPNIKVVYSSSPEIVQLLSSGEVWAANGIFADAKSIADSGIKIKTVKVYPVTAEADALLVVKGGKEDLAMKFLDMCLEPANQAAICYALGGTPTGKNVPPPPASIEPYLATPADVVVLADSKWVSDNKDNFVENWERTITPLLQ